MSTQLFERFVYAEMLASLYMKDLKAHSLCSRQPMETEKHSMDRKNEHVFVSTSENSGHHEILRRISFWLKGFLPQNYI
ncbi:Thymidine kinase [Trichinella pseudospiralis]